MNKPVKWAAELEHVREVSLLGTADLAFWKDRLLTQDLLPIERDGQAQLLIVAADSKFKGIRFRELCDDRGISGSRRANCSRQLEYLSQPNVWALSWAKQANR